jgi:acyl carrier protein
MPSPDAPLVAELAGIVRDSAKIRPEVAVDAESLLVEDLGIDSLDLVGISLRIQRHYGVEVDADELPNLRRLGDVAAYVARRRGPAAA